MPSYRRLRWLVVLALAVAFVLGLAGELPRGREIFPFASWFLFVLVPNRTVEYDVEFRAVDDRPLDPPLRFSRAAGYVFQPHGVAAFNLIQQLGRALNQGDAARTRALRRQFDALCGPARLQYDVVKVTFDPVPRYDTGAVVAHQILGTFVTRES